MKKVYLKPEQEIVELQYCKSLLAGSLRSADTSLDDDDDLSIDNTTPVDDTFWGR